MNLLCSVTISETLALSSLVYRQDMNMLELTISYSIFFCYSFCKLLAERLYINTLLLMDGYAPMRSVSSCICLCLATKNSPWTRTDHSQSLYSPLSGVALASSPLFFLSSYHPFSFTSCQTPLAFICHYR